MASSSKVNRLRAKTLTFKKIKVGDRHSFRRFIIEKDVKEFARLTGDYNPLHMDEKFAKSTQFRGRIIHGMLAASLFSTLIGMYCPGKYALILNQEISYIRPIRPNSRVLVIGEVVNKIDAVGVIVIKTLIRGADGNILIEGISKVKVTR